MKSFFSLIFIVIAQSISGQDKQIANNLNLGMCYNSAIESVHISQLNNFLANQNYFGNNDKIKITSIGLSIRETDGQSIYKMVFQSGRNTSSTSHNNTSLRYYGIGFDYLYDFAKTDKWLIAPLFGAIINNYQLDAVSQNSVSQLSGTNLVENFQAENKFLCNIGLEVDRQIKFSFLNVHLGLEGYYNIDFIDYKWETVNSNSTKKVPPINFSGLGVSFNIRIEFNWNKIYSKQISTE